MIRPFIIEIILDIIVVISKQEYSMLRIIIGKSYCAVMVVIPIFWLRFFCIFTLLHDPQSKSNTKLYKTTKIHGIRNDRGGESWLLPLKGFSAVLCYGGSVYRQGIPVDLEDTELVSELLTRFGVFTRSMSEFGFLREYRYSRVTSCTFARLIVGCEDP